MTAITTAKPPHVATTGPSLQYDQTTETLSGEVKRNWHHRIRLLQELDIPWMLDLGNRRYPDKFDRIATEGWFRNLVLKGPLMFLPVRTDDAFLIAMLSTTPWSPSIPECNIALVCADDGCMWQAVNLLRFSIEWAKQRKCSLWRLSSETNYDLTQIALKVGAKEPNVRWVMRF